MVVNSTSTGEQTRERTRVAIEFVCEALHFFGISFVTAEILRRAKHNEDSVEPLLWALVQDLLSLSSTARLSKPTGGRVGLRPLEPRQAALPRALGKRPSPAEGAHTVFLLLAMGYPRVDSLGATLCAPLLNALGNDSTRGAEGSCCSRELLLAVGFLIDEAGLLDAFMRARAEPKRLSVPAPPYPLDVCCSQFAVKHAQDGISTLRQRSERVGHIVHKPGCTSNLSSVDVFCHSALQLHTRLRCEAKRAEALDAHRLMLLQQLQELGKPYAARASGNNEHETASSTGSTVQEPALAARSVPKARASTKKRWESPSQYELFVLEKRNLFDEHLARLEMESWALAARSHEQHFWRWMTSVLTAADSEPAHGRPTRSSAGVQPASSSSASATRNTLGSACHAEASESATVNLAAGPEVELPGLMHVTIAQLSTSCIHVEQALANLHRALREGFLNFDSEWRALQRLYDHNEEDLSEHASGRKSPVVANRFHDFLRQHWENCKRKLKPEHQRPLKQKLRDLGLAFDRVMVAPWRSSCPFALEDGADLLQHLTSGVSSGSERREYVLEPYFLQKPQRSPWRSSTEVQRHVETVRASYDSSVVSCSDARSVAAVDLEVCHRLAVDCGVRSLRRPRRRSSPKSGASLSRSQAPQ